LPLQYALVELLDLRSSELLGRTYTNAAGYYEFPSVGVGLYVVRFHSDQEPRSDGYDKAVEVRPNAAEQKIPAMKLVDRGCDAGLSINASPMTVR